MLRPLPSILTLIAALLLYMPLLQAQPAPPGEAPAHGLIVRLRQAPAHEDMHPRTANPRVRGCRIGALATCAGRIGAVR
jgi:hypothetical protein